MHEISTSPAASTQPRTVCICLFGLCGTLQGLVDSRWHFGWPWGSTVAPWASILTYMGHSWEGYGHFGETICDTDRKSVDIILFRETPNGPNNNWNLTYVNY